MTFKIKVIQSNKDYQEAFQQIEELMMKDPDPESEDGEKLNLLTTLIEDYESRAFPRNLPDPVDAILFRMEQANLRPVDLVPYIGSRSKVSEILSRKRPLTLTMIRALEAGLNIPAKVLLKEMNEVEEELNWNKFPLKEMIKRNYFSNMALNNSNMDALLQDFFPSTFQPKALLGMLRKTSYRSTRPIDKHALFIWSAVVVKKANVLNYPIIFRNGLVNLEFMQKVARLSIHENGPLVVQEFLKQHGIALVIEPHFPQTYIDGATLLINADHPIIGLTLRYDRLDNFWFTLMHELAHLSLHYGEGLNLFYDDLDTTDSKNEKEGEADRLALEALIPENKWEYSPAKLIPSSLAAESLAKELGIHIAIVAGRMRRENDRYRYLNTIINNAKVRTFFPEEKWSK